MFSNLSQPISDTTINYPITDSRLPFAEYIQHCQAIIEERRENIGDYLVSPETVIQANSPFECLPQIASTSGARYGALMIHGLLDCPFTYRELGSHLQSQGILSRAILLPGHGTKPSDLMKVSYHDWLQAVRYGIESLKQDVDHIYLIGYSTGAALSIYHAMQDNRIAGIVLLSPAIKVRTPVDLFASWFNMVNYFGKNRNWVYNVEEVDYVKYKSIPFNGVKQVTRLTESIREMRNKHPLDTPMYMILSREDETISSHDAIDFFTSQHHPDSKMLLYTSLDHTYPDSRIITRKAVYPDINVAHMSHPALSFSAKNPHYGQQGDYLYASRLDRNYIYGAYNRIEMNIFEMMAKCRLTKAPRRVLTYNPDFENMAKSITQFIKGEPDQSRS